MIQLRTILAVFFNPNKAFRALLDRPRAMAAVLLLIVAGLAVHVTVSARIDQQAQVRLTAEKLADEPGKKPSETEIQKEAVRALNVHRIVGYVLAVILVPLLVLILAILFWLPCRFSRQRVPFKTGYSIAAHLWLPYGLRQLISIPVILTYPGLDPTQVRNLFKTDLGSLIPVPGAALVDPFWIWTAVLFAAALRTAGWKTWKSAVAGVIVWLILGSVGRALV
jgi:uncharacterized membrane protein